MTVQVTPLLQPCISLVLWDGWRALSLPALRGGWSPHTAPPGLPQLSTGTLLLNSKVLHFFLSPVLSLCLVAHR